MTTPSATQGAAAAGPESALARALENRGPAPDGGGGYGFIGKPALNLATAVVRALRASGFDIVSLRPDPAPTLDAAWQRAERALPAGWVLDGLARMYAAGTDANGSDVGGWTARAYYHGPRGGPVQVAVKETPAAALNALASKLEGEDPA